MVFNSPEFLIFFVAVYAFYLCLPGPRVQNAMLLAASYVFYGWAAPRYLVLLLLYTVLTYGAGLGIGSASSRRGRRVFLCLGLAINLCVLAYFKYANFFVGEFVRALASLGVPAQPLALQIFLPIGISFFTFQSIAYLVDVYRGRAQATRDLLGFALFKAFFPQLVAGPIERIQHMLPQIQSRRRITREHLLRGAYWILLGFFLKCVIADRLAPYVDYHFGVLDAPARSALGSLSAVWAFGLQIYGDFAGYTYIALGSAQLMGFELQRNFLGPYLAGNIQEFWRRWHVTLSLWLRDYLYVPLGGSKRGRLRTYANLIVTMALGGLWHGASWNFVLWGLFHGVGLALHRASQPALARIPDGVRRAIGWPGTLLFVMASWALFRAGSLGELRGLAERIVSAPLATSFDVRAAGVIAVLTVIVLLVQWLEERRPDHALILRPAWHWRLGLTTGLALASFGIGFSDHRFIYFQF